MQLNSFFSPPATIYALFGRTMLWLPVTFFVWVLFAPILHAPIAWAIQLLSWWAIPAWLTDLEQGARTFNFLTSLKPPSGDGGFSATARVQTEVNGLLYTYGIALFAALTLAAAQGRVVATLSRGYFMLLPFLLLAIYATGLKQIAFDMGPIVAQQMEFTTVQRTIVAYAYQFSTLIMPPVTALLVWFVTHRDTVQRFVRQGLPMRAAQLKATPPQNAA